MNGIRACFFSDHAQKLFKDRPSVFCINAAESAGHTLRMPLNTDDRQRFMADSLDQVIVAVHDSMKAGAEPVYSLMVRAVDKEALFSVQ